MEFFPFLTARFTPCIMVSEAQHVSLFRLTVNKQEPVTRVTAAPMDELRPGPLGGTQLIQSMLWGLKVRNYKGQSFIPDEEFFAKFTESLVDETLDSLVPTTPDLDADFSHHPFVQTKAREYIFKNLRKHLAILVNIGKGDKIWHFCSDSYNDNCLPWDEASLKRDIGRHGHGDQDTSWTAYFVQEQYVYLSLPFRPLEPGTDLNPIPDSRVLPIIKKERLDAGGFGTVYKISIFPSYDKLGYEPESREIPHEYACKYYHWKEGSADQYKKEVLAHNFFHRTCSEHIMPVLTGFKYKDGYYMILPLADCNLATFMQKQPRPISRKERHTVLKSFSAIFIALSRIHNSEQAESNNESRTIASHCDMTNSNILRKGDRFYLADFGLSRLRHIGPSSHSGFEHVHGISTYRAPECRRGAIVGRPADVWSLGCLLCEMLTFVLMGLEGIQQFKVKRITITMEENDQHRQDWFHQDGKVKREVLEWINYLVARFSTDRLVVGILRLVKDMLKTAPTDRPTSKQAEIKLLGLLDEEEAYLSHEQLNGLGIDTPYTLPSSLPLQKMSRQTHERSSHHSMAERGGFTAASLTGGRDSGSSRQQRASTLSNPFNWLKTHTSTGLRSLFLASPKASSIKKSPEQTSGTSSHIFGPEEGICLSPAPYTGEVTHTTTHTRSYQRSPRNTNENRTSYQSSGPSPRMVSSPVTSPQPKIMDQLVELRRYRTVILIDNASSSTSLRKELRQALIQISSRAITSGQKGIDLKFIENDCNDVDNVTTVKDVEDFFEAAIPEPQLQSMPLWLKLDDILSAFKAKLQKDDGNGNRLNLIIITKGEYSETDAIEETVVGFAEALDNMSAPISSLGLQFVLIRSEKRDQERFFKLDDKVCAEKGVRDIVDVTVYDPIISSEEDLQKILIGGFNRRVDGRDKREVVLEETGVHRTFSNRTPR